MKNYNEKTQINYSDLREAINDKVNFLFDKIENKTKEIDKLKEEIQENKKIQTLFNDIEIKQFEIKELEKQINALDLDKQIIINKIKNGVKKANEKN